MDYCFGIGDGTVTAWDAPPNADLDGDGVLDAVRLDFDGDGLFDDMMWDADGDGSADHSVLDIDDDGRPEAYFADDGLGAWTFHVERSGSISWFGLDGIEHPGGTADLDGDGTPEELVDVDGDGDAERAIRTTDSGSTMYVDTTGDGRWDVALTDGNGDGVADAAQALGRPQPSAQNPVEGPP